MKNIMENWKKFLKEASGLQTTWDPGEGKVISLEKDLLNIIGRNCEEGRECIAYKASELENRIKTDNPGWSRPELEPERIERASLEHPLVVVVKDGKYQYILDGNHRLRRALNNEKDKYDEEGKELEVNVKVKEFDLDEYNELFGGETK